MFKWGKPTVSVDQYAPILQAAMRDFFEGAPDSTEELIDQDGHINGPALQRNLQAQAALFERVNARRLELEQVKPEPRLTAVHDESVKFLRAALTTLNITAESLQAALEGDFNKKRRKDAEYEFWNSTIDDIMNKLGGVLRKLQNDQPTLFQMLGLPRPVLTTLGVEPEALPVAPGNHTVTTWINQASNAKPVPLENYGPVFAWVVYVLHSKPDLATISAKEVEGVLIEHLGRVDERLMPLIGCIPDDQRLLSLHASLVLYAREHVSFYTLGCLSLHPTADGQRAAQRGEEVADKVDRLYDEFRANVTVLRSNEPELFDCLSRYTSGFLQTLSEAG
jgi:hypothetical protein